MAEENHVPLNERDHLSFAHLFAISANQLTANFIFTPINQLIMPMCLKLGLDNTASTLIMLIGSVAGIVVPPLVGSASDSTMAKLGRRRPWMITGEVLSIIGLMFMAFCDKMSTVHGGQIACLVIGQTLASVGGNVLISPGRTLCTDVTPPSQQVVVGNLCMVHQAIAGIISNLIGALKLYEKAGMENSQFVMMISCIIGFVAFIASIVTSQEEQLKEKPAGGKNPIMLVVESVKIFDLGFWLVGIANFCFFASFMPYLAKFADFVGSVVFGGVASGGTPEQLQAYNDGVSHAQILNLFQTVVQFVFSFASTYITKWIGLMGTWIFGTVFGTLGLALFAVRTNKWFYITNVVFLGIGLPIVGGIPNVILSLYASPEVMAGVQAVMLLCANLGAVIAQFAITMGLGAIKIFSDNSGYLLAVCSILFAITSISGAIGIHLKESGKPSLEEVDNEDPIAPGSSDSL